MDNDVSSVWSNLGSSMGVPSVVREELEKLRIEVRDVKLQVARDISELREVISSLSNEMDSVVQRHLSLMTRLEGLESRAQTLSGGLSGDFNAFAYVQLDELQEENSEESVVSEFEEVVPEPVDRLRSQPAEVKADDKIVPNEENSDLTDEDIAYMVYTKVKEDIASIGGVLNNQLHLRYPEGVKGNPTTKKLVKGLLDSDDDVSVHKLDKFRSLYYTNGDDPNEVYERTFG
jgi:hypothetical protein